MAFPSPSAAGISALRSSPLAPRCCEAPHSFPHSHFHSPVLGFASTLSSASFAQLTSHKTIRDAPIRLYSRCRNEATRDRGVCASRLFVSGICHCSGNTQFVLGRFSARLNPNVPLQTVIRFCSHGRCHLDAHFARAQPVRPFGSLTPACGREALRASRRSALLWLPRLPGAEQVQELSQTGLG